MLCRAACKGGAYHLSRAPSSSDKGRPKWPRVSQNGSITNSVHFHPILRNSVRWTEKFATDNYLRPLEYRGIYIYICVCVCEVDLFRPFGMDPLKLGLGCRCPTTSVGHVTFGLGFEQDMSMRSVPFKTLKGR